MIIWKCYLGPLGTYFWKKSDGTTGQTMGQFMMINLSHHHVYDGTNVQLVLMI